MKKKRIIKILLVSVLCITCSIFAVMQIHAAINAQYCEEVGYHTAGEIRTHGYVINYSKGDEYCYDWQQHYSCSAICYYCGEYFSHDHVEGNNATHVWDHQRQNSTGGYQWCCGNCHTLKFDEYR